MSSSVSQKRNKMQILMIETLAMNDIDGTNLKKK
jgi:hypothetical protein